MSTFHLHRRTRPDGPYVSEDMGVPERKEPREPGPAYVFVPTLGACCILVFYILFGGLFAADRGAAVVTPRADPNALSVATWNVAAINNNPFEYWITHDDKAYNELMADVQAFVSEPGSRDVPVSEVFTDAMWGELEAAMTGAGWAGVPDVAAIWNGDFRNRKIVTEFLKDGTLGKKRLASMPDRVTNTIRTASGSVMRPTVINCFSGGDLGSGDAWWANWKAFFFSKKIDGKPVYELLLPIKRSKYPALSEAEEKISIPLQTLAGAIFDAILVHMMNAVAPKTWQPLRAELCAALNSKKDARTAKILETVYGDADVVFLQETAASFGAAAKAGPLGASYHVVSPASLDPKRDQNSLVLLSRARFPDAARVSELSDDVLAALGKAPVAAGDLLAIVAFDASNRPYVFASFHGDTNGLATLPVTDALLAHLAAHGLGDHKLVFGLDANTYAVPRDGYQAAAPYQAHIVEKGLASQYGDAPDIDVKRFSTFNARTYLQPQLNKAVAFADRYTDINVDRNPKDFVLFTKRDFQLVSTNRDNTGGKKYVDDMMFPTLKFPSDHAVTSATLRLVHR
mmetsp:Transcript_18646/g.58287  ORF Transcript_18646/g.58287 Transcript_18646/m.58287 type:complete len:571 (-) Transcript_18646:45-1757(-)